MRNIASLHMVDFEPRLKLVQFPRRQPSIDGFNDEIFQLLVLLMSMSGGIMQVVVVQELVLGGERDQCELTQLSRLIPCQFRNRSGLDEVDVVLIRAVCKEAQKLICGG